MKTCGSIDRTHSLIRDEGTGILSYTWSDHRPPSGTSVCGVAYCLQCISVLCCLSCSVLFHCVSCLWFVAEYSFLEVGTKRSRRVRRAIAVATVTWKSVDLQRNYGSLPWILLALVMLDHFLEVTLSKFNFARLFHQLWENMQVFCGFSCAFDENSTDGPLTEHGAPKLNTLRDSS